MILMSSIFSLRELKPVFHQLFFFFLIQRLNLAAGENVHSSTSEFPVVALNALKSHDMLYIFYYTFGVELILT